MVPKRFLLCRRRYVKLFKLVIAVSVMFFDCIFVVANDAESA